MRRSIEGFRRDDEGEWVADLSCHHRQHVRHRPPFWERPWVLTESGRAGRVGTELECPLCDRAELPGGLHVVRTAGPFDQRSVPAALRRSHRIAEGTWGRLRVIDGAVGLVMATRPPFSAQLGAGDEQPIPPSVVHNLVVEGPLTVAIDFLVKDPATT